MADVRGAVTQDELKPPEGKIGTDDLRDALKSLLGETPAPTPAVIDPAGSEPSGPGGGGPSGSGTRSGGGSGGSGGSATRGRGSDGGSGKAAEARDGGHKYTPGSGGGRPFISYLGTHPDDEGPDPDGLAHQERLAIEDKAIALILAQEPELTHTPTNNPGFDLVAADENGAHVKWVEVKAMTGTMQNRPVGLSRTQFEAAREHGPDFWLYVVEQAGSSDQARVVRIQDPAGRARTFTFDHGWLSIADLNDIGGPTTEEHGEE